MTVMFVVMGEVRDKHGNTSEDYIAAFDNMHDAMQFIKLNGITWHLRVVMGDISTKFGDVYRMYEKTNLYYQEILGVYMLRAVVNRHYAPQPIKDILPWMKECQVATNVPTKFLIVE